METGWVIDKSRLDIPELQGTHRKEGSQLNQSQQGRKQGRLLPCKYEWNGCVEMYHQSTLLLHEFDCPHHTLPCVYDDCPSELTSAEDMVRHLVEQHKERPVVISTKHRFTLDLKQEDLKVGQAIQAFKRVFYAYFFRYRSDMACLVMVCSNRESSVYFQVKVHAFGDYSARPITRSGKVMSILERDLIYRSESRGFTCVFEIGSLWKIAQKENEDTVVHAVVEIQAPIWR